MQKNRQQKKTATKNRILEAAATLFIENGYENTSYGEIAKKAKVGYGTVYSHFSAKEDILLELSIAQINARIGILNDLAATEKQPIKRLFKILDHIWKWDMETPRASLENFYAHRWKMNKAQYERLKRSVFEFIGGVAQSIDEAKTTGAIDKSIDTQLTVHLLNSAYYRALQDGRFDQEAQKKAKAILVKQIEYLLNLKPT